MIRLEGFDIRAAVESVRPEVDRISLQYAEAVAAEARQRCPFGKTGRLRDSIRVVRSGKGYAILVNHPGVFVEKGHDIVRDGRKIGHAPAYPFLRPALLAVARRGGAALGGAAGEFAGSVVGRVAGRSAGRRASRNLRAKGEAMGAAHWENVAGKLADVIEAESGLRGTASGELLKSLGSGVSARRRR